MDPRLPKGLQIEFPPAFDGTDEQCNYSMQFQSNVSPTQGFFAHFRETQRDGTVRRATVQIVNDGEPPKSVPDGTYIVCDSSNGTLRFWTIITTLYDGPMRYVNQLSFTEATSSPESGDFGLTHIRTLWPIIVGSVSAIF